MLATVQAEIYTGNPWTPTRSTASRRKRPSTSIGEHCDNEERCGRRLTRQDGRMVKVVHEHIAAHAQPRGRERGGGERRERSELRRATFPDDERRIAKCLSPPCRRRPIVA